ncbi:MAG: CotH kinase family protein [Bacteroidia bacterium]|nr:CotH kinase family protein [Bacteroidia bacterium]
MNSILQAQSSFMSRPSQQPGIPFLSILPASEYRSCLHRCCRRRLRALTALHAVIMFLGVFSCTVELRAQRVEFTASSLPIVVINTDGVEIPDEPKVPAYMGIIRSSSGANHIDSTFTDYDGLISIELRGNSSLTYDQKQYLFKTVSSSGQDSNVVLMDFPAEHEWILFGPAVDKSLMRNVLMFRIARELGWYASRTQFCELVLNGDYRGVYVLMENVKRDKSRVNISKIAGDITSGEPLTGGYILAIDHNGKQNDKGFAAAEDSLGTFVYWYIYPSPKNINVQQEWYIQGYVKSFEALMRHPAFNDPLRGYAAFLNLDSFIDYILLNEWSNNVDSYVASAYLHKDRQSAGGKLTAGPVWDFNIAFGNANYAGGERSSGWRIHYERVPFWWRRLLQDTAFVSRLEKRWTELRASSLHEERVGHIIDSVATLLDEAQVRHFLRWDLLGTYIWPNAYVGESYLDEVDYLKNWIRDRLHWMDRNLPSIALPLDKGMTTAADFSVTDDAPSITVYPTPSAGSVTVRYETAATAGVEVVVRDLLGRVVQRVTQGAVTGGTAHALQMHLQDQPTGLYQIILMHNGAPSTSTLMHILR